VREVEDRCKDCADDEGQECEDQKGQVADEDAQLVGEETEVGFCRWRGLGYCSVA
jgi:hypothetical protein